MDPTEESELETAMRLVLDIVNRQKSRGAQLSAVNKINEMLSEDIQPVAIKYEHAKVVDTVRLLSFNVDMNFDGKFVSKKIIQFCELIKSKQINIFCLQEIKAETSDCEFTCSRNNFCDDIIKCLDGEWKYVFEIVGRGKHKKKEGGAIFYNENHFDLLCTFDCKKEPFNEMTRHPQMTDFKLKSNGSIISVINVHLVGGTDKRSNEIRVVELDFVKSLMEVASKEYENLTLLCGDLNTDLSERKVMSKFNAIGAHVLSSTHQTLTLNKAAKKVDFVLVSVPSILSQYSNEPRCWQFKCHADEITINEEERKLAGGQHLSDHCPIAFEIAPTSVNSADTGEHD